MQIFRFYGFVKLEYRLIKNGLYLYIFFFAFSEMMLKSVIKIGGRYSEWAGFLYKHLIKELIKQVKSMKFYTQVVIH